MFAFAQLDMYPPKPVFIERRRPQKSFNWLFQECTVNQRWVCRRGSCTLVLPLSNSMGAARVGISGLSSAILSWSVLLVCMKELFLPHWKLRARFDSEGLSSRWLEMKRFFSGSSSWGEVFPPGAPRAAWGHWLVPGGGWLSLGTRHTWQGGQWLVAEGVSCRPPQVRGRLPAPQGSPLHRGGMAGPERDVPDPASCGGHAPGPRWVPLPGPAAANRHGYPELPV